ncbi:hypothetical protein [Zhaonella formicivorans]|jgi:hypothetical protein|uniref:hypothetical protein n=1 Tax=Zhaonella formicivorans TaxID=2528593 RepID=UPI0010D65482|nr:hypothetical protein [Zhaonella formicivorans]
MKVFIVKKAAVLISYFLLGALCGAIWCTVKIGNKVDELYYANRELELKLENANAELAEVKSSLTKSRDVIVTKIKPEVKLPPERFTTHEANKLELAINQEIINHYKPLVGLPVKSLEPALLPKIIDGRILEIEQKRYKILVKTMVISETLYVEAEIKK